MKIEISVSLGVNLKEGFSGGLAAKQTGSIGGEMVNDVLPVRPFVFAFNLLSHFSVFLPVNILISSLAVTTHYFHVLLAALSLFKAV